MQWNADKGTYNVDATELRRDGCSCVTGGLLKQGDVQ
jgi:hypothetical protein